VAASTLAWEGAGADDLGLDPKRIGVIIGSALGGLLDYEKDVLAFAAGGVRKVTPLSIPRLIGSEAPALVAMKYGLTGTNYSLASACATGTHSIGEAFRAIKFGTIDAALAGGTDAGITPVLMAAFSRAGEALSKRNDDPESACRPFERDRDGFVMGEGAGVLMLESRELAERRGAPIIAEIVGYGTSSDAHHITQPHPEGVGAALALQEALEEAGMGPDQFDYLNAHGTGTALNDKVETRAIKDVFGPEAKRLAVSSTKSQMGHAMGGAGAIETAITALAVQRGVVPATLNYDNADPECDLDYVGDGPREMPVRAALKSSCGFGGHNAAIALRRA
jgi:3-oxoacyl-[acyl-carrier-protein] synthase II